MRTAVKKVIQKIQSKLQKQLTGYETEVLTFSQAGEDLIVRNFFYERLSQGGKGFYVDIGAFHPYWHSNTYYLYRGGWRGINIDARPNSMKVFDELRPKDINLEVAISDKEGTSTYYDFGEDAGLNTMSEEYIEKLGTRTKVKSKHEIKTSPLGLILENHVPKDTEIDFLSIDIEGMEEQALSSNNWSKYRPKLIACEIYGHYLEEISSDGVSQFLAKHGYEIYARVILSMPGVNTVFFVESK